MIKLCEFMNARTPGKTTWGIRLLMTGMILLLTLAVNAQNVTVQGKVTDASNGEPIPGANVIVKGTTTGTVTNGDGEFTFSVTSLEVTLQVSFIGYTTQEIPLQGRSSVNVALEPETTQLDEIIAVGYGQAKRSDYTGSIATISGQEA